METEARNALTAAALPPASRGGRTTPLRGWTVFGTPTGWTVFQIPSTPGLAAAGGRLPWRPELPLPLPATGLRSAAPCRIRSRAVRPRRRLWWPRWAAVSESRTRVSLCSGSCPRLHSGPMTVWHRRALQSFAWRIESSAWPSRFSARLGSTARPRTGGDCCGTDM